MRRIDINCTACGARIPEDLSKPTVRCEYCGAEFATEAHAARHAEWTAAGEKRRRLEAEITERTRERKGAELAQVAAFLVPVAAFFASLAGRVVVFLAGLLVVGLAAPVVCQFGFLAKLGQAMLPAYDDLPLVGSLYASLEGKTQELHVLVIGGLLLGLGLALVKRRVLP